MAVRISVTSLMVAHLYCRARHLHAVELVALRRVAPRRAAQWPAGAHIPSAPRGRACRSATSTTCKKLRNAPLMTACVCSDSTCPDRRFSPAPFRRRDFLERGRAHQLNVHSTFVEAADGERPSIRRKSRGEDMSVDRE